MKRVVIIISAIFCAFFLSILYIGIFDPKLSFIQSEIGTKLNSYENGAWWGENVAKIVEKNDEIFTFIFEESPSPRDAIFYHKSPSGAWQEGQKIAFNRPPNILITSKGHVQVIGHVPLASGDPDGWIWHYNFTQTYDVAGGYFAQNITWDWQAANNLEPYSYSSVYLGAAIGPDDTIMVAYTNTAYGSDIYSLGAKILNTTTGEWEFDSITTTLPSRYCYPFVFITEEYFHVYAIEDHEDPNIPGDFPYRFGAVKHFQRMRNSSSWIESTLVDLNNQYTSAEISKIHMRISDFYVDSSGVVHALLTYGPFVRHFTKVDESSTIWQERAAISAPRRNIQIWERSDGKLFYVAANFLSQITTIPIGSDTEYIISNIGLNSLIRPAAFLATRRTGSDLGTTMNMVVYSGYSIAPALHISVDMSEA